MYKYLLLVALLCSAHLGQGQKMQALAAQQPVATAPAPLPGSYRFGLDSLLAALDKAQVPSGMLYDRVMLLAGLAGLHAFNTGVGTAQRGLVRKDGCCFLRCVACFPLHHYGYETPLLSPAAAAAHGQRL
ncbi:hypothetical protein [Hymenobacter elongatus]|uniref:Uncharacterized protein n=1 Tax=Hymenobacter elongatus TaxID=877208 RepID=A0A4Z0PPX2_9BACT|nr:hypothetical protein [Hymenobacter elongatus]TGE17606.1 hypothetical protein E5J99_07070 [Hymenobacter elongatus]